MEALKTLNPKPYTLYTLNPKPYLPYKPLNPKP